jgi:hypothetical protein
MDGFQLGWFMLTRTTPWNSGSESNDSLLIRHSAIGTHGIAARAPRRQAYST